MTNVPNKRLRLSMADLPKDLLAAIGDVTVSWGYVLNLMEVAIWGMLGLDTKTGSVLTAPFMYRGKMDMFNYVGRDFFRENPTLLDEFKSLVTRIGNTYSRRNEIEHSTWQHIPGWPHSISVKITRAREIQPQAKTAQDVDSVAQDIIKLVMELNDFMEKHIPPPKSLQDKFP